jgi:hypothetical protein
MARGKSIDDAATLQMALVGYQLEKQRIESKIQEIQSLLKGKRGAFSSAATAAEPARKRELSESARARIAAAQKRRWAEHRKRAAQAAKAAKSSSPKTAAAS